MNSISGLSGILRTQIFLEKESTHRSRKVKETNSVGSIQDTSQKMETMIMLRKQNNKVKEYKNIITGEKYLGYPEERLHNIDGKVFLTVYDQRKKYPVKVLKDALEELIP